jgi:hypothetical protein
MTPQAKRARDRNHRRLAEEDYAKIIPRGLRVVPMPEAKARLMESLRAKGTLSE